MRRRGIIEGVLVALLAFVGPVLAQEKAILFSEHDLTNAAFTCGVFTGDGQKAFYSGMRKGPAFITTAGSVTTTTALIAGSFPFAGVGVGDILSVQTGPAATDVLTRYVTAKATDDSVTVSSAWDLTASGRQFSYLHFTNGTAITDGWVDIGPLDQATFLIRLDTVNATSIDAKVECRHRTFNTQPTVIFPPSGGLGQCQTTPTGNFTAAGGCGVDVPSIWESCRVCFKINTDTGVNSVSADVIKVPRSFH